MKKLSILLLVMLMAGCGGMRMQGTGDTSGASGTSGTGTAGQQQRVFPQMDPSFEPYFGG